MRTRVLGIIGALALASGVVLGGVSAAVAQTALGAGRPGSAGAPGTTVGVPGAGAPGMFGGMMGMGYGPGRMGGAGIMAGIAGQSPDQHFIQEMIPHHEDAVAMADLATAQAEHADLKALAATITSTQTGEIAQMRQWYRTWYGTAEVPPSAMAAMGQAMQGGAGMMTGRGQSPQAVDGAKPFDQVFIEQMIPHHQMAVMMSSMLLQRTEHPELRALLQSIIVSQSEEIRQMSRWYAAWYPRS